MRRRALLGWLAAAPMALLAILRGKSDAFDAPVRYLDWPYRPPQWPEDLQPAQAARIRAYIAKAKPKYEVLVRSSQKRDPSAKFSGAYGW